MLNTCINLCIVAFDYKGMFCEGNTVYNNTTEFSKFIVTCSFNIKYGKISSPCLSPMQTLGCIVFFSQSSILL